jgi:hypothetical protein
LTSVRHDAETTECRRSRWVPLGRRTHCTNVAVWRPVRGCFHAERWPFELSESRGATTPLPQPGTSETVFVGRWIAQQPLALIIGMRR